jgi:hypothetical protein
MADPAGKEMAAETPASKLTATAIRDMNRPARIMRIFMKTICRARENIIILTGIPSFVLGGEGLQPKVCAAGNAVNREDDFAMRTQRIQPPIKGSVSPIADTSEIYRREAGKRGVMCGQESLRVRSAKSKTSERTRSFAPPQTTPGTRADPDNGLPTGG